MRWPRSIAVTRHSDSSREPRDVRCSRALVLALLTIAAVSCGDDDNGESSGAPSNQKPSADFAPACSQLECTFTEASTDDGGVAAWRWDFGDGTDPSTEQNPVHTYAMAGQYRVTLTVTDNQAASGSVAKDIAVSASAICADPTTPDDFVPCAIDVPSGTAVRVTISSESDCAANGDTLRIVAPINEDVFTDGCHAQKDVPILVNGGNPFLGSPTALYLAMILESDDPNRITPSVHAEGGYPEWSIRFEDGGHPTNVNEPDFNDLVITVTATTPTSPWGYLRQ
jgi:PKD repeat protein